MTTPRQALDNDLARIACEVERAREHLRNVMTASAPDELRAAFEALATDVKERPILFSSPMVRAIIAGSKRQTRRIVKNNDFIFIGGRGEENDPSAWGFEDGDGCWHVLDQRAQPWYGHGIPGERYRIACPYGAPGDRLWVRETWGPCAGGVVYRADDDGAQVRCPDGGRWTPSIHMPRWASRIALSVESVRVERLHAITDEDARAEGIGGDSEDPGSRRVGFAALWSSTYGTESWDANPWVWAICFGVPAR